LTLFAEICVAPVQGRTQVHRYYMLPCGGVMAMVPRQGDNEVVQCPICIGTGRIYPTPLICWGTPQTSIPEGVNGIACPNCEGFGKIGSLGAFNIKNK
jgi:hypothetical protein